MRLRLTFAKTEAMRFTGHLDLHRTWERTFRRADLPLAYSQGFHPQPRLNLASALPLGFTSQYELADVWLEKEIPLEQVQQALQISLPPGLQLLEVYTVDSSAPSLQTRVVASEFEVTILDPISDLDNRLEKLLSANSLIRERRGKSYDLRPLIEEMHRIPDDDQGKQRFSLRMTATPNATGRPEEVLLTLDIPLPTTRILRTKILFN